MAKEADAPRSELERTAYISCSNWVENLLTEPLEHFDLQGYGLVTRRMYSITGQRTAGLILTFQICRQRLNHKKAR